MRSADWKVLASLGLILGVLFLLGGIFAYIYAEQTWIGWYVYPYRDMATPLMIIGVVLFVVGIVCNTRAREEKRFESGRNLETARFCPFCGYRLPSAEAKYCGRCGKELH